MGYYIVSPGNFRDYVGSFKNAKLRQCEYLFRNEETLGCVEADEKNVTLFSHYYTRMQMPRKLFEELYEQDVTPFELFKNFPNVKWILLQDREGNTLESFGELQEKTDAVALMWLTSGNLSFGYNKEEGKK